MLASYLKQLQSMVVKHRTDNQNVVALFNGSKNELVQELVVDIFKLCIEFNIQLVPEWIPRGDNQWADFVSKDLDRDDYMLHPDIFAVLDVLWGPHAIDRFSSLHTRKIPRFCSHWASPFSEAIDAFTVSWSDENNWLFPPPYLIPRVLRHLKFAKFDSTLFVPFWTSAPWWPLLVTHEGSFQTEIVDFKIIAPRENLFINAVPGLLMFSSDIPSFNLLALTFSFAWNAQDLLASILFRSFLDLFYQILFLVNCKGAFCLFLGYGVSLSSLGKHPDPHIRQLAQDLPHFFMLDWAPSTLKKYYGSFSKWQTWAFS